MDEYLSQERKREWLFMLGLYFITMAFFVFNRETLHIEADRIGFFFVYALFALFISYFLLPRFFYKDKVWLFFVGVALTLAFLVFVEEWVLEKIFYYGTRRAKTFQGFIRTLVGVFPIVGILSGAKFAWDAFRKQKSLDQMQHIVNESELQFLKSQINPHFLFNNLNNLYAHALEGSSKTPEIILELSSVLRYMLYECREEFVPLSKELEHLKNFIQLYEMQIGDRGSVDFKFEGNTSGLKIAPLILVIFIENAFKHSTASQSGGIDIEINVHVDKTGKMTFNCSNTYHEDSNTDSIARGIGLENVKKRLKLIYPGSHELRIFSENDLFKVELELKLTD